MTVPVRQQGVWLAVLRRHFLVMAPGSLAWEFAHMPLYTLWKTGTPGEIVFAALHCTGGDIVIATVALAAALLVTAPGAWPERGYGRVAATAIALGTSYTIVSEWLNVGIRQSWAYRDPMPVVPILEIGLSPLAQWIILPSLAFWWAGRLRGTR